MRITGQGSLTIVSISQSIQKKGTSKFDDIWGTEMDFTAEVMTKVLGH